MEISANFSNNWNMEEDPTSCPAHPCPFPPHRLIIICTFIVIKNTDVYDFIAFIYKPFWVALQWDEWQTNLINKYTFHMVVAVFVVTARGGEKWSHNFKID